MNIVLYRQAKILLRESRIVEATPADSVVAITQSVVTPIFIHVEKKKLDEMEMEATQTLIVAMTIPLRHALPQYTFNCVIFVLSTHFWRISNYQ